METGTAGAARILRRIALSIALLALGACASTRDLRDFTTDGCSVFPDASGDACWADCCVEHDRAYWRGGTADERRRADAALRECVARADRPTLGKLMYRGVRVTGMPLWPTWFRWGYGWGYGRGYEPLTPAEQRAADEKLAARRPAEPDPSCP
jgi:hypothetical protein